MQSNQNTELTDVKEVKDRPNLVFWHVRREHKRSYVELLQEILHPVSFSDVIDDN